MASKTFVTFQDFEVVRETAKAVEVCYEQGNGATTSDRYAWMPKSILRMTTEFSGTSAKASALIPVWFAKRELVLFSASWVRVSAEAVEAFDAARCSA